MALGRTAPRAELWVDETPVGKASAAGYFVIGFDRDAPALAALRVQSDAGVNRHSFGVAPGDFDIQRIDGLPESQVSPSDPALLERIKVELARKTQAQTSRYDGDDFKSGFAMPLDSYRLSGKFGGQRILNGVPKRPHYGCDLAAPTGTPIKAPGGGLVIFAEPDMHFEGGLTMIDHGQGLITMYLHQSRQLVRPGQRVERGAVIGEVGMKGRATGPHLCWRMKWRDRNLDPMLMVGIAAPGL